MSDPSPVVGLCMDMCPESEVKLRTKCSRVHCLEKNRKFVKEFSRCAAGKEVPRASALRPSNVLLTTMDYLMGDIVSITDHPWTVVYDFINDRINAIRQDMTIQRIDNDDAVKILEKAVRFYLSANYFLCDEPIENFDMHLNNKQLFVCLRRVIEILRKNQFSSKESLEFLSIHCTYNMGSIDVIQDLLQERQSLPSSTLLDGIIAMNIAFLMGNFIRFFNILSLQPVMVRLGAFRWLPRVRHRALNVLCSAYSSKNCKFPLSVISQWLHVSECYASDLCKHYKLNLQDNYVVFKKSDFDWDASVLESAKEDFIFSDLNDVPISKIINS